MPKIHISNPDQFAKDYPHLVKTTITPDRKKIINALRDGWQINGVDLLDGEEPTEDAAAAMIEIPAFLNPKEPAKPLGDEEKGIREILVPKAETEIAPKKFDEKLRLPGEELREFHQRMTLLDKANALEAAARRKAGL